MNLGVCQTREKIRCRKKRKRNFHISELNSIHYEHHSRFPLEQDMTHLSFPHLLPHPCMALSKHLQKCLVSNRNSIHHTGEDEWKEVSIFLSFCVSSSSPHHLFFWFLIWANLHCRNFQRRQIELVAHIWLAFVIPVWKSPQKTLKKSEHLILFSCLVFLVVTFSPHSSGRFYPSDFQIVFLHLMLLPLLFWSPDHDFKISSLLYVHQSASHNYL